jgi:hypothetical protein
MQTLLLTKQLKYFSYLSPIIDILFSNKYRVRDGVKKMTEDIILTLIWLFVCVLCIWATLFFKGEDALFFGKEDRKERDLANEKLKMMGDTVKNYCDVPLPELPNDK